MFAGCYGSWGGWRRLSLQTDVPSVVNIAVWFCEGKWMSFGVDTLIDPTIYLHLSLCFDSEGGCFSSNGRRTTHQNPWCHSAASSAALQVSVVAHCLTLAGLGTAVVHMCVCVKIKGFCSSTLHRMESFNRSRLTWWWWTEFSVLCESI